MRGSNSLGIRGDWIFVGEQNFEVCLTLKEKGLSEFSAVILVQFGIIQREAYQIRLVEEQHYILSAWVAFKEGLKSVQIRVFAGTSKMLTFLGQINNVYCKIMDNFIFGSNH